MRLQNKSKANSSAPLCARGNPGLRHAAHRDVANNVRNRCRKCMGGTKSSEQPEVCVRVYYTACLSASSGSSTESDGRNTENAVQLLSGSALLFTRIDPLCLSTMFLQTHRP